MWHPRMVTTFDVASYIRRLGEGELVSFYREGGEEFDIVMEIDLPYDLNISVLENMLIGTPSGELVPVEEIAQLTLKDTPRQINRVDRVRMASVNVFVEGRDLGSCCRGY